MLQVHLSRRNVDRSGVTAVRAGLLQRFGFSIVSLSNDDLQAAAQGVPPSTIPDSVDDDSFCMMANDAAFENALQRAAAATAARFKRWGQPAAAANDTAVGVSASRCSACGV